MVRAVDTQGFAPHSRRVATETDTLTDISADAFDVSGLLDRLVSALEKGTDNLTHFCKTAAEHGWTNVDASFRQTVASDRGRLSIIAVRLEGVREALSALAAERVQDDREVENDPLTLKMLFDMRQRRWTERMVAPRSLFTMVRDGLRETADSPFRWQHIVRGQRTDFWKISLWPRMLGDVYLLYYGPGQRIGKHIDLPPDTLPGGFLRLNVVLRQPKVGGVFEVEFPETLRSLGDRVHLFRPDETFHWVSPVGEGESRWVLSVGFWLPSDWLAGKILSSPHWYKAVPPPRPQANDEHSPRP